MTDDRWTNVKEALKEAKAISWDGCHKIYVSMDDEDVQKYIDSYEMVYVQDIDKTLTILQEWYDDSCGLRFISAVHTVKEDPNSGYVSLIPQFDDEDEDE